MDPQEESKGSNGVGRGGIAKRSDCCLFSQELTAQLRGCSVMTESRFSLGRAVGTAGSRCDHKEYSTHGHAVATSPYHLLSGVDPFI